MKYVVESSLENFPFWGGAVDIANKLDSDQFEIIEDALEDMNACSEDLMTDGEINDLFWFEPYTIADWLGYKDWEHFKEGLSNDLIEDADNWAEDVSYLEHFSFTLFDHEKVSGGIDTEEIVDEDGKFDADLFSEAWTDWWEDLDDFEKYEIYSHFEGVELEP